MTRTARLTAAAAALAVTAATAPAHAEVIYGLLNNDSTAGQRLVTIDSVTRAVTSTVLLQTPSPAGTLSSIDVRPATGELFAYAAGSRQFYTVNPTTGGLTAVGAPLDLGTVNGAAIDFNPTVDRIRLIGTQSGNQNYRVVPTTGAIAATDGPLAYGAADSGAGLTPNVAANAYTNSVAGATTTSLYDIDIARDALVLQSPPNDGTLQTVGLLGFDAGAAGSFGNAFTGFDVSGGTNTAYLTDSPVGTPPFFGGPTATTATLYTVNLTTGAATQAGLITGLPFGRSVQDIAVAAVPEPATAGVAAVGAAALLTRRAKGRSRRAAR